jgi:hypothetical protein
MKPVEHLKGLYLQAHREKYPNFPEACRVFPSAWKPSTANGLSTMIIAYIKLTGGQAYRINCQGQYDAKLKKWRYSGMRRGLPDIQAVINGRFIGIEVKIGTDRQSEHQKKIQAEIIQAGGLYLIITSFDQFYQWFTTNFR